MSEKSLIVPGKSVPSAIVILQVFVVLVARLRAVTMVGLIVQHEDALEAHQLRHDALEHLPFALQRVQRLADATLEERAPAPGQLERVVVGDDDLGAVDVVEHVARRQLAAGVVAVLVVGEQDAPVTGVCDGTPPVHVATQLVDDRRGVVLLLGSGNAGALIEDKSLLTLDALVLLRPRDGRDEPRVAPRLDDLPRGLAIRVELPVAARIRVRRVEDRPLEERLVHRDNAGQDHASGHEGFGASSRGRS
jgi:hypothetical protein